MHQCIWLNYHLFFYFAFQGVGLACHSFSTFFFSFFLGCGYASCFYFLLSVIQILLFLFIYLLDLTKRGFFFHDFSFLINLDYCIFFCHYFVLGENTIVVPIFWRLRSIWSLHFSSSQFGPSYFQFAVNLVPTVNSLTKNAYVANGLPCSRICG